MRDFAVIMALKSEAGFTFEGLPAVYFSGIGKVNAAIKTMELIHNGVKCILNLGTAGSDRIKPHQIVQCSGFYERDLDVSGINLTNNPFINVGTKDLGYLETTCATGDSFASGFLVDMEGYAIARACAQYGVDFHSYKYITDNADPLLWDSNLEAASIGLREVYDKWIK